MIEEDEKKEKIVENNDYSDICSNCGRETESGK